MSKNNDLRDGPATLSDAANEQPAEASEGHSPSEPEVAAQEQPPPPPPLAPIRGTDFQLKALPVLLTIAMLVALLLLPSLIVDLLSDYIWLPVHGSQLANRYATHTVMLLLALGLIRLVGGRRYEEYGLRLPKGRSYVATAIILGLFFGVIMTLVDYAPEIVTRTAPHGYTYQLSNMGGWLFYQGLFVGPTEEVPYRSLFVTYLTQRMPGKIRYRRIEMNGAGVVVAAIFAGGFGFIALITQPILIAIGQILYVFFGNLVLAYLFEKSGSVLAPVIGHNVALFTWQSLVFVMLRAWRG